MNRFEIEIPNTREDIKERHKQEGSAGHRQTHRCRESHRQWGIEELYIM